MANEVVVKPESEITMAERFTTKVMALFKTNVGEVALTNFQKRLVQNYFITADMVLKSAEEKRKKKKKNQDPLAYTWANVDMDELAQSVVSAARTGWDPMQDNHVSLIPFKKAAVGKYGLTFMPGYRGIELKAVKYGLEVPSVIVELVYSTDKFKSIKKDHKNKVEAYEFEVVNDFDRGNLVGGFYYHMYPANPEKNKLVVFTLKDIEKRKPRYASPEFWGGEKDVWENGVVVGKEKVEGWYDKMCHKTIYRAAYKDITIDSQKIDDDYLRLNQLEHEFKEAEVEATIAENANGNVIDIQSEDVSNDNEPDEGITDAEIVEMDKKTEGNATTGPGF